MRRNAGALGGASGVGSPSDSPLGARRADRLDAETWRALAASCRLNQTFILRRVATLGAQILDELPPALDHLTASPALRPAILAFFARRLHLTVRSAVTGRPHPEAKPEDAAPHREAGESARPKMETAASAASLEDHRPAPPSGSGASSASSLRPSP